jgi:hypothetical protein
MPANPFVFSEARVLFVSEISGARAMCAARNEWRLTRPTMAQQMLDVQPVGRNDGFGVGQRVACLGMASGSGSDASAATSEPVDSGCRVGQLNKVAEVAGAFQEVSEAV